MRPELMDYLSVGAAAAALLVTGVHSAREAMRSRAGDRPAEDGDARRFSGSGTAARGSEAAAGRAGARGSGPEEAEADRSAKREGHDVAGPRGGEGYDPRPLEDKARRRIAYLLIALLALQVTGLLVMVAFGVITVDQVKEFDVIVVPLVTLVAAATSFYYASKRK